MLRGTLPVAGRAARLSPTRGRVPRLGARTAAIRSLVGILFAASLAGSASATPPDALSASISLCQTPDITPEMRFAALLDLGWERTTDFTLAATLTHEYALSRFPISQDPRYSAEMPGRIDSLRTSDGFVSIAGLLVHPEMEVILYAQPATEGFEQNNTTCHFLPAIPLPDPLPGPPGPFDDIRESNGLMTPYMTSTHRLRMVTAQTDGAEWSVGLMATSFDRQIMTNNSGWDWSIVAALTIFFLSRNDAP